VRRPERGEQLAERYGIKVVSTPEAAKTADILVIAVKPQDMSVLLDELGPHVPADRLVVSIAAGIPTSFIAERMTEGVPVVRVMSNTPALVDQAMSAISAGAHATAEHLARTEECACPSPSRTRSRPCPAAARPTSTSWSRR
jgi:pyrroline-5-carboxylate reductase